uniref:G-protein coupled receptors family 1 profile domain-containing protein n=1 Tax=Anopheles culicifacies TaxID=139723 RepID=A0A182ML79_9DIPT
MPVKRSSIIPGPDAAGVSVPGCQTSHGEDTAIKTSPPKWGSENMLDFPNGTTASSVGVMSFLGSGAAFLDELGTSNGGGLLLGPGNTSPVGGNGSSLGNYSTAVNSSSSSATMLSLSGANGSVAPLLTTALLNVNGTGLEFSDGSNLTHSLPNFVPKEFIFDRTDVRIIFITLYSLVFCCCFFGNLLVILVVTLSRRLRSITNFFLANLAVADLCVGVFCVMQNLTIYLIERSHQKMVAPPCSSASTKYGGVGFKHHITHLMHN